MANIGNIVWLINSNPVLYFLAQTLEHKVSIISEFFNDSVIFPAFMILQGLWKVPVVQSNLR